MQIDFSCEVKPLPLVLRPTRPNMARHDVELNRLVGNGLTSMLVIAVIKNLLN